MLALKVTNTPGTHCIRPNLPVMASNLSALRPTYVGLAMDCSRRAPLGQQPQQEESKNPPYNSSTSCSIISTTASCRLHRTVVEPNLL